MPRKKAADKPDFEKAMAELESLVEQMESGDLSLEASLEHFEKGVRLTRQCQQALKQAEQKVSILLKQGDEESLQEFATPDNDTETGS